MSGEIPLGIDFMQPLAQVDVEPIAGQYNPATQTWEHVATKSGEIPQVLGSFGGSERPGTMSTVPTRITPTHVKADTGPDD